MMTRLGVDYFGWFGWEMSGQRNHKSVGGIKRIYTFNETDNQPLLGSTNYFDGVCCKHLAIFER